jgi:protein SCO1/2
MTSMHRVDITAVLHRRCGLAAAVALTALAGACSSTGPKHQAGVAGASHAPPGLRGVVLSQGLPKPHFTLTDTAGQPYDFRRQTEGYTTLMYFGYTHCPDVCPTHMADIAAALRQLPASVGSHVKVVFAFIGLTGTDQQVRAAEAAAGMPPSAPDPKDPLPDGSYSVGHGAQVEAFTTDDLAHVEYPSGYKTADWVNDLPKLVRGWPGA